MNKNNHNSIHKILLFSFDYPPNKGGISRLCTHIVEGLNNYCSVKVLTQKWNGKNYTTIPDIPTVRVFYKRNSRVLRFLSIFTVLPKLIFSFRDCNIILCGEWYVEGIIALLSNVIKKRKIVILAHGNELITKVKLKTWIKQKAFSNANLIIANSNNTLNLVINIGGTSPSLAITLAVDTSKFYPHKPSQTLIQKWGLERKRVLLSVSSLRSYKAHDIVLKALHEIPEKEQYVYLIAGVGPNREAILSMARELGLENQVRLLGFVPENKLREYYNLCDISVLCTRENLNSGEVEGFGLVFLETQACGKPVIGVRAGGIPDAIKDRVTGWLIPQDDHSALRDLLVRLFDNPNKIKEAGVKARHWVEQECTLEKYIKKLWYHINKMNNMMLKK